MHARVRSLHRHLVTDLDLAWEKETCAYLLCVCIYIYIYTHYIYIYIIDLFVLAWEKVADASGIGKVTTRTDCLPLLVGALLARIRFTNRLLPSIGALLV